MIGHYGPMLRALAHNRRDYRVLVFATAIGFTVVVQALAFASLFLRNLEATYGVDEDRIVIVGAEAVKPEASQIADVAGAIRALPGVEDFAWVARKPFRYTEFGEPVAPIDDSGRVQLAWPAVGDEHLIGTLGLTLLAGRNYAPRRAENGADVEAVVTRSLATFLSGKESPDDALGLRFLNGIDTRVMRVVGVVSDMSVQTSFVPDVRNTLFTYSPLVESLRRYALVRVAKADDGIVAKIAETTRARGYWADVTSLVELHKLTSATSLGAVRVQVVVILVVLFVGLIGNFGAASFLVAERSRTIGIRRALGASRTQIMRYFLEENIVVTTGGIVMGIPLALAVARAAEAMQNNFILHWQHMGIAALLFYCTSLWAAHAPALKASRIPPSVVSQAA